MWIFNSRESQFLVNMFVLFFSITMKLEHFQISDKLAGFSRKKSDFGNKSRIFEKVPDFWNKSQISEKFPDLRKKFGFHINSRIFYKNPGILGNVEVKKNFPKNLPKNCPKNLPKNLPKNYGKNYGKKLEIRENLVLLRFCCIGSFSLPPRSQKFPDFQKNPGIFPKSGNFLKSGNFSEIREFLRNPGIFPLGKPLHGTVFVLIGWKRFPGAREFSTCGMGLSNKCWSF